MFVFPLDAFHLTANKSCNAWSIVFSADNTQLVSYIKYGILIRTVQISIVLDARNDEVTTRKTLYLQQLLAVYCLIAHFEVERMRLFAGILKPFQVFLLILDVNLKQLFDKQYGTNDANHTQGIGTSITQGNGVTCITQLVQCLLSSTKTRSVRHCSIEYTNHHRQLHTTIYII